MSRVGFVKKTDNVKGCLVSPSRGRLSLQIEDKILRPTAIQPKGWAKKNNAVPSSACTDEVGRCFYLGLGKADGRWVNHTNSVKFLEFQEPFYKKVLGESRAELLSLLARSDIPYPKSMTTCPILTHSRLCDQGNGKGRSAFHFIFQYFQSLRGVAFFTFNDELVVYL